MPRTGSLKESIAMFTDAQLAAAVQCPTARAARWLPHLVRAMSRFDINTRHRAACFLGQLGHESLGLSRIEENLNYSVGRLTEVFPSHFTVDQAREYARNPEAIANRVYGGRMGNGAERSGDGWRYRGRSPIQLTGKTNYALIGGIISQPLVEQPGLALELGVGADIAAAFWHNKGLNTLADSCDIAGITRRINGGRIGLADRVARTQRALAALGEA